MNTGAPEEQAVPAPPVAQETERREKKTTTEHKTKNTIHLQV